MTETPVAGEHDAKYWSERVTKLTSDLELAEKGARGAAVGTLAIGIVILIAMWAVTHFGHIVFIWGWGIGGLLVLGGIVVMFLGGPNKSEAAKIQTELADARQKLSAAQFD